MSDALFVAVFFVLWSVVEVLRYLWKYRPGVYPGPVFHLPGSKCGQVTIRGIQWVRYDEDSFVVLIKTEEGWRRIGRQYFHEWFCESVTPLGMFDESTFLETPAREYRGQEEVNKGGEI